MANEFKPFYVRLRPRARQLLDKASEIELKSRAEIIDELITTHLEAQYADVISRLDQMLSQGKAAR